MSDASSSKDLLKHLAGRLDEDERSRLEDLALSDEDSFEELSSQEDELVDAYIRGELNPAEEEVVAALIAASPRLQESAELGAALGARNQMQRARQQARRPAQGAEGRQASTSETAEPKRTPWIVMLVLGLLTLAAFSVWQAQQGVALRQRLEERQQGFETLRQEAEQLEQSSADLRRRLSRAQAEKRLLEASMQP